MKTKKAVIPLSRQTVAQQGKRINGCGGAVKAKDQSLLRGSIP